MHRQCSKAKDTCIQDYFSFILQAFISYLLTLHSNAKFFFSFKAVVMMPVVQGPPTKFGPSRSLSPERKRSVAKGSNPSKGKPRKKDDPDAEKKAVARKRFVKAAMSVRAFIRFQKVLSFKPGEPKKTHHRSAVLRLENTYRTEPEEHKKFHPHLTKPVVEELLAERLSNYTYDKSSAPKMARALTATITDNLKAETKKHTPRYKLICNVFIGQITGQGINVVSRSVWNEQTDNFISVEHKNSDCFAIAMVHAVYME